MRNPLQRSTPLKSRRTLAVRTIALALAYISASASTFARAAEPDRTKLARSKKAESTLPSASPAEAMLGVRLIHRSFQFTDVPDRADAARPYAFALPVGPAPFVDVGLYPMRFFAPHAAVDVGIVGGYEALVGTDVAFSDNGQSTRLSTFEQQYYAGLRARMPLGLHEIGLAGTYGAHSFHVADAHVGGSTGALVPNVDYTFVRIGADARFIVSRLSLGAHAGVRLVRDTGSLERDWMPVSSTRALDAGLTVGVRATSFLEVVASADWLRYAFTFDGASPGASLAAGGAIDQTISGAIALRITAPTR